MELDPARTLELTAEDIHMAATELLAKRSLRHKYNCFKACSFSNPGSYVP